MTNNLIVKIKYSYKKKSPRTITCEYQNSQNFDIYFWILRTPWGMTNYSWKIRDDGTSNEGNYNKMIDVHPKNPATTISAWKKIPKNGKVVKKFKLDYSLPEGNSFTVECDIRTLMCARSLEFVGGEIETEDAEIQTEKEEK